MKKKFEYIFTIGRKVYDQLYFPGKKGKIVDVKPGVEFQVEVEFDGDESAKYDIFGMKEGSKFVSLSTEPYNVCFEGFRQEEDTPSLEEAEEWLVRTKNGIGPEDGCKTYYPRLECSMEFEYLRQLVVLMTYYNKGWKPDWKSAERKYVIYIDYIEGDVSLTPKESQYVKHLLAFRSGDVRDAFMRQQKSLIYKALPLL